MEALAIVGLVGNIVQFIDFSGDVFSAMSKIHASDEGALAENLDIEKTTSSLRRLTTRLQNTPLTGDTAVDSLSQACNDVGNELLEVLHRVKASGKRNRHQSIWKAFLSVRRKGKIEGLERRLSRLREHLTLHIVVQLRDQISQSIQQQPGCLEHLDPATRNVATAIVEERDMFQATRSHRRSEMTDGPTVTAMFPGMYFGAPAVGLSQGGALIAGGGRFDFGQAYFSSNPSQV